MDVEGPFVCAACVGDTELKKTIREYAISYRCSFCNKRYSHPAAAPIEDVVDHIRQAIEEQYDRAVNQLPYDSEEGGFFGDHWDTRELLTDELELDLPHDNDNRLLDALVESLTDDLWCRSDGLGLSESTEIRFDWEAFCNLVKHRRRYTFLDSASKGPDHMLAVELPTTPSRLLSQVFRYAVECRLFRALPTGTRFFRARFQNCSERIETPEQLGPPPEECAFKANRMSPAGIVMFYAADDADTAIAETFEEPGTYVVGEFVTTRPATVLDLCRVPKDRGPFWLVPDSAETDHRRAVRFLNAFARNVSEPIAHDNLTHIEYVPTQVFTEYVRFRRLNTGKRVDGIRYSSSLRQPGRSIVLFANQSNVVLSRGAHSDAQIFRKTWIKLVGRTEHRVQKQPW